MHTAHNLFMCAFRQNIEMERIKHKNMLALSTFTHVHIPFSRLGISADCTLTVASTTLTEKMKYEVSINATMQGTKYTSYSEFIRLPNSIM